MALENWGNCHTLCKCTTYMCVGNPVNYFHKINFERRLLFPFNFFSWLPSWKKPPLSFPLSNAWLEILLIQPAHKKEHNISKKVKKPLQNCNAPFYQKNAAFFSNFRRFIGIHYQKLFGVDSLERGAVVERPLHVAQLGGQFQFNHMKYLETWPRRRWLLRFIRIKHFKTWEAPCKSLCVSNAQKKLNVLWHCLNCADKKFCKEWREAVKIN